MTNQPLITIFVFRRSYGRRYSDLPVDTIDREHLLISCKDTYTRPQHYDLRVGDIVRWRQGERFVEARISTVQRGPDTLTADLADAVPLPPEFFPY